MTTKAAALKAAKGASIAPEAPPPPPIAPPEDPLRLELMRLFLAQRQASRADISEFNNAKQNEWLKFFGFSMERELMWARERPDLFKTAKKKDGNSPSHSGNSSLADDLALSIGGPSFYGKKARPKSPTNEFKSLSKVGKALDNSNNSGSSSNFNKSLLKGTKGQREYDGEGGEEGGEEDDNNTFDFSDGFTRSDDPIQGNKPIEGSNGLAYLTSMREAIAEADARALSAPKYEGKSVAYVTEQLIQPYKSTTWRLDEAQTALLKARAIYRWICKNMTAVLPSSSGSGADGAAARGQGKTLTFADLPSDKNSSPTNFNLPPHNANPLASISSGVPTKSALSKKSQHRGSVNNTNGNEPTTTGDADGERERLALHGGGLPHHNLGGLSMALSHMSAAAAAASATMTTTSSDPILASRVATPRNLASLYADFLLCAGVEAKAVKGTLKGTLDHRGKPAGYLKWGWNVFVIPAAPSTRNKQLQLLVDLSLSMVSVNPRAGVASLIRPKDGPSDLQLSGLLPLSGAGLTGVTSIANAAGGMSSAAGAPSPSGMVNNNANAAKQSPRPMSPQMSKGTKGQQKDREKDEEALRMNSDNNYFGENSAFGAWKKLQEEKQLNYSAARPKFIITFDLAPHFEPFYFGCDPRHFASLHFPDEPDKYLFLQGSVSRPQWESYPRLNHLFYKHKLKLDSHKRRTTVLCRAAPLYVSFTLGDCAHVEMTAAVFKGTISQQEPIEINHPSNANALGPGYVYSQRSEKAGKLTFVIMAPDVGVYTVVFGARRVNEDLSQIGPCNSPFDIVATYQVQMNFVALNEPILPHQHLTPATVKLAYPQDHKAIVGKQRFVVVPTSPRVLCVAVVNNIFKHSSMPSNVVAVGPNTSIPLITSPPSAGGANGAAPSQQSGGKLSPKRPSAGGGGGKTSARGAPPSAQGADTTAAPPSGVVASTQPPLPPPPVLPPNVRITVLELDASAGVFAGEVDLQQGSAEIWTLLGDPRCLANTTSFASSRIVDIIAGAGAGASKANVSANSSTAAGASLPPIFGAGSRPNSTAPSDAMAAGGGLLSTNFNPRSGGTNPSPTAHQVQRESSFVSAAGSTTATAAIYAAAATTSLERYPSSQLLKTFSPELTAALPIEEKFDVRNGSNGRIQGVFVQAISNIAVVKRILPKEYMLNEGRGVIQPVLAEEGRLAADLPYIFRLMSGSTSDGRRRTSETEAFIGRPLRPVGSYFADKH